MVVDVQEWIPVNQHGNTSGFCIEKRHFWRPLSTIIILKQFCNNQSNVCFRKIIVLSIVVSHPFWSELCSCTTLGLLATTLYIPGFGMATTTGVVLVNQFLLLVNTFLCVTQDVLGLLEPLLVTWHPRMSLLHMTFVAINLNRNIDVFLITSTQYTSVQTLPDGCNGWPDIYITWYFTSQFNPKELQLNWLEKDQFRFKVHKNLGR